MLKFISAYHRLQTAELWEGSGCWWQQHPVGWHVRRVPAGSSATPRIWLLDHLETSVLVTLVSILMTKSLQRRKYLGLNHHLKRVISHILKYIKETAAEVQQRNSLHSQDGRW